MIIFYFDILKMTGGIDGCDADDEVDNKMVMM